MKDSFIREMENDEHTMKLMRENEARFYDSYYEELLTEEERKNGEK